jgi:hypothetical protein
MSPASGRDQGDERDEDAGERLPAYDPDLRVFRSAFDMPTVPWFIRVTATPIADLRRVALEGSS